MASQTSHEPGWIIAFRVLAAVVIAALGLLFAYRIVTSDASLVLKVIGVLGVAAIMGGGAIRIWLASRPYGLGSWEDRER